MPLFAFIFLINFKSTKLKRNQGSFNSLREYLLLYKKTICVLKKSRLYPCLQHFPVQSNEIIYHLLHFTCPEGYTYSYEMSLILTRRNFILFQDIHQLYKQIYNTLFQRYIVVTRKQDEDNKNQIFVVLKIYNLSEQV